MSKIWFEKQRPGSQHETVRQLSISNQTWKVKLEYLRKDWYIKMQFDDTPLASITILLGLTTWSGER